MPTSAVSNIVINTGYIGIKFLRTLKVSTITNDKFTVATDTATPVTVSSPFKTIVLSDHYNSVARTLTLHWNDGKLVGDTDYKFTIAGLVDASGTAVDTESFTFTTGSIVDPTEDETLTAETEPVVIDYSISSSSFTSSSSVTTSNPNFYITDVLPDNGSYYIEEDYANGRVTIKFSKRPSSQFLNTGYFRTQRKKLQRAPIRWETVDVQVAAHSNKPWVFVDFPSTDATPVYTTDDKTYFEEGYKYRIIVSKDVST